MTNPHDDDATLQHIYSNLTDNQYTSETTNRRRTARDHLDLVTQYHPSSAKLLDIGCATGLFVCEAQAAGWQGTGLEASSWAISLARQRCPKANFISGTLETTRFEMGNFQVITLWDVLEHVRSPHETLTRVHAWLKPEGLLFLNLPNFSSPAARLMGKHWVLLLREHIWYFSPTTLQKMLKKTGFSMLQTRTNSVHFSLANIFSRLAQYPGLLGKLSSKANRFNILKSLTLRFPIGEMSVVARKNSLQIREDSKFDSR